MWTDREKPSLSFFFRKTAGYKTAMSAKWRPSCHSYRWNAIIVQQRTNSVEGTSGPESGTSQSAVECSSTELHPQTKPSMRLCCSIVTLNGTMFRWVTSFSPWMAKYQFVHVSNNRHYGYRKWHSTGEKELRKRILANLRSIMFKNKWLYPLSPWVLQVLV